MTDRTKLSMVQTPLPHFYGFRG